MQTEIEERTYVPKAVALDGSSLLKKLCHRYPSVSHSSPAKCLILGDEDGIYHLLHNAVRNAVRHGEAGAEVKLQLESTPTESVFSIFNKPGANHQQALELQSQQGRTSHAWN